MTDGAFVSYAQNGEDVVLHRALRTIERGRYIDVGANDPCIDSVSMAFYRSGWRGITVEPVSQYAERQRIERPEDILVEAVVTQTSGEIARLLEVPGTGLSSLDESIGEQHRRSGYQVREVDVPTRRLDDILDAAGWQDRDDIHFLSVDVEGTEAAVLASLDLRRWRPWIILAEATRPNSSEPTHQSFEPLLLAAGYRFSLFDGLSRYYIAEERWDQLHEHLSTPASALDNFVRLERVLQDQEISELQAELKAARSECTAMLLERNSIRDLLTDVTATLQTICTQASAQAELAAVREKKALASALAWRTRAVGAWADSTGASATSAEEVQSLRKRADDLDDEMTAMKSTLSWRITGPLRAVRLIGKMVNK
ncbi:FkbM family methyltransferase [Nakamurella sp. UYEF19]|uniref:FkbM family methyltransferase n=1 Tax=Nakamurella sp. UYEF19 TaxID=1756392 RepID=UPI003395D85C